MADEFRAGCELACSEEKVDLSKIDFRKSDCDAIGVHFSPHIDG
jgi:hypothetical protein